MQDVISALLGMLPSRTSSVASSHRRYEGDSESSDDPHDVDSSIEERSQMHANRAMKHGLGRHFAAPWVRWVCVVREGASYSPSSLAIPPLCAELRQGLSHPYQLPPRPPQSYQLPPPPLSLLLPLQASAPLLRPARSYPSMKNPLWPYPRASLDDSDDIVEFDFADTSALSDIDAFERRRQNGKNGAKLSKDRGRRSNVRGMCLGMFPATSMPSCRPRFWGERHGHRPIPLGVLVGRQPGPRLANNRVLSRPISPTKYPRQ